MAELVDAIDQLALQAERAGELVRCLRQLAGAAHRGVPTFQWLLFVKARSACWRPI